MTAEVKKTTQAALAWNKAIVIQELEAIDEHGGVVARIAELSKEQA